MNIHINKTINKSLKNNEIKINIEASNNTEIIDDLIRYINGYKNEKIIVYKDNELVQVSIEDIIYFYSEGNYNYCKTLKNTYKVKSKLYEIEKYNKDFLRISKSCIININQVKSFDIGTNRNIVINFFNGEQEYVARRKIKDVLNYLDERGV